MLACIGVKYHRAGLLLEYGRIYRGGGMCIMSFPTGGWLPIAWRWLRLAWGVRICHSYE